MSNKTQNLDFLGGQDVVAIAKELIGMKLTSYIDGTKTSGIIIETEAYAGINDKASHAYGGRRTNRTETMYDQPGTIYVYLCYGIHHLLNFVTNQAEEPHAVLIRAIKPLEGIDTMLERRKKTKQDKTLTNGPGTLSQALGITTAINGTHLEHGLLSIEPYQTYTMIEAGPRIGVDYAGEDALLPYRFWVGG